MEYKNVGNFYDGIRRRMNAMLERKTEITDGVKNIITEVVVRRCEEFSQNAPELNRDIDSLTAFLDTVEFGKMAEGYERAAGVFSIGEKKITLGQDYLNRLRRDLFNDVAEDVSNLKAYETFTHELYHAMSKRPNGLDRLTHYSPYTGERMVSLQEMVTEVSATRSTTSNSEENFKAGIRQCNGYGDLTFSVGVMAAVFGMTEKEFLKAGMEGFSNLEQQVEISGGSKDFLKYFTDIDIVIEKMYSQLHPWGVKELPSREQIAENLSSDTRSLIDLSQEAMRSRIMFSDKPLEELSAELAYNHEKLENNLNYAIRGFTQRIGKENADKLYIQNKIQGLETKKIVRGLASVVENKENMEPELFEKAVQDIRSGKILMDYKKYAEEYGLESVSELSNSSRPVPKQYLDKVRKDDFSNGKVWDNREILDQSRDSLINNRFVHRIEDSVLHSGVAVRNGVKHMLGKEVLALPPAQEPKMLSGTIDKNEKSNEEDLAFGELPSDQKRMAQEGYIDALRAIHTKESGIEERASKNDKER